MHTHSLVELSALLQKKKISSVELVSDYLKRIETHNASLNAYIHIVAEDALRDAKNIDEKRSKNSQLPVFAGIPVAHKDIFLTKGVVTSCGSKSLAHFIPPYNSTVVSNFNEAGMIQIGKLNMDEFAMGGSNETSVHGPCFNPWDLSCVPGGSSGGSAAAVAARLAPCATGTDTGGSIRQPASHCGITGIKPSYGVVSRFGMIAFASSLDQAGPMATSAEDCAHLLSIMASFDPKNDMTSIKQSSYDYTDTLELDLKGLKIGLPKEYFNETLDREMAKLYDEAVDVYRKLGANFVSVDLPDVEHCVAAYYTIAPCEASSNLARFDGNIYGYRSDDSKDLESMYPNTRSNGFGKEVQRRILTGTYALSSGYYDDYYIKAQNIRNLIRHDFHEAFKEVDVILAPTVPSPAFKIGHLVDDPVTMYQQDAFTIPVNLAELPSISVPCGYVNKLPVGFQIIGPRFQERKILNVAHQYQKVTDWHNHLPKDYK